MILRGTVVTFLVSQTAWILFYIIGSNAFLTNPLIILSLGAVFIPGFAFTLYKLLPRSFKDERGVKQTRSWFYYMCCLFAWSCVIDLIGALEAANVIDGWFDFYLEKGEPYLGSPFGVWIDAWDATVHYAMYLVMIYKMDNGKDYSRIGLYWAGDMLAGMFCLVIGAVVGSYGADIHPATFLNIPYIVLPFLALKHLLQVRSGKKPSQYSKEKIKSIILDSLLLLGLTVSILFGFLRGLAALGSPLHFVQRYITDFEPYILEPGKFGAMHCLFNFMYCLPLQVIIGYYLVQGNGGAKAEIMALLLSGALAQGCFFHLMPSFYHQTPENYQVTKNKELVVFLNILPVIIAHLLILKFQTKNENGRRTKKKS